MSEKKEIMRVHDKWIALEKAGKEKDVLGLCATDVAWLVPGQRLLHGVDKVRSFLESQPRVTIRSIDTFDVEVEVSGALAVKRARFRATFVDAESESTVEGAHVWTLRKDSASATWTVTGVAWAIAGGNA